METTKERIVRESLRLFSQYGYDSIGVSEIAKKSGITKPSLYYYFESKENLLKFIVEHFSEKLRTRLNRSYDTDGPLAVLLVSVTGTYLEFCTEHEEFIRLYLSLVFTPHENASYHVVKTEAERIQSTIEGFFNTDPRFAQKKALFAASFIGQMNMFATLILNGYTTYSMELSKTIVTMFFNGAESIV